MQNWFIRLCVVGSTLIVVGCQAVPLPEDFSKVNTIDIVQKIRCEARDAVTHYAIKYLTDASRPLKTQRIGQEIERDPEKLANMKLASLDDATEAYFRGYMQTFLYYEFTLDMSNGSSNSAGFDLLNIFGNGSRRLVASTSIERTNQNIRTFRLGDTIDNLMGLYLDDTVNTVPTPYKDDCRILATGKAAYPITGNIGLNEFIDTFVELDRGTGLEPKDKVDDFVETLTFTTGIKGGISPKIVLTSFVGDTSLTEAGIDSSVSRVDKHQVILSIAANRPKETAAETRTRAKNNLTTFKDQNNNTFGGSTGPSSVQLLRLN